MAVTVRDVLTRALRLAGIVAVGETPSGDDTAAALDDFKDMLEEWRDNGIDLGIAADSLTVSTNIAADRGVIKSLRYNLAVELANGAGLDVSATTRDIADRTRGNLSARLRGNRPVRFDTALVGRRRFDIDEG